MLSDPPSARPPNARDGRRLQHDAARVHRRDREFECLRTALRHRIEDHSRFSASITVSRMLRLKPYSGEARRAELTLQQTAMWTRVLTRVLSYLPWLACTASEAREATFTDDDEGELPTPLV